VSVIVVMLWPCRGGPSVSRVGWCQTSATAAPDRIALTAGHDGTGQGAREGAQSNGLDYGCDLGSPANFYSTIQLSNRLSQAVVKTHVTH
jgi:hypothetical protein